MGISVRGRADYWSPGDWNALCSMCGRKRKASSMVKNWQGLYRCPEHNEPRQPQDFARGIKDVITPPWIQPPPTPGGTDLFTKICNVDGQSAVPGLSIPGCMLPGNNVTTSVGIVVAPPPPAVSPPNVQTFITPGGGTWTKPPGAKNVTVTVIGGGGGASAGVSACGFGGGSNGPTGGGGAGYARVTYAASILPATVSLIVGAKGLGGISSASATPGVQHNNDTRTATDGGTSSFGVGTVYLQATGGTAAGIHGAGTIFIAGSGGVTANGADAGTGSNTTGPAGVAAPPASSSGAGSGGVGISGDVARTGFAGGAGPGGSPGGAGITSATTGGGAAVAGSGTNGSAGGSASAGGMDSTFPSQYSGTLTGGTGADGQNPGDGGAGGGPAITNNAGAFVAPGAVQGGPGGNGAPGQVIVTTTF
jgi:hypothetical protein